MDIKQIINLLKNKKLKFTNGVANDYLIRYNFQSSVILLDENFKELSTPLNYRFVAGNLPNIVGYCKYKEWSIIKYLHLYDSPYIINIPYPYVLIKDDKIDLKKELPLLNDETINIISILQDWFRDPSEEYGNKLLHSNIPSYFKKVNKKLYKGVSLSPKAMKKLSMGKTISLQKRKFSSWTTSIETADDYSSGFDTDNDGAILQYKPTNKEILINVDLFMEKVIDITQYTHEAEVILLNSKDTLTVDNSRVYKLKYFNK